MKTIYLAGGGPKNTAIKILTEHLEGLGHRVTRDAQDPNGWDCTIRWGVSYRGDKSALNANVNRWDKLGQMFQFVRNKVLCPYPYTDFEDYVNIERNIVVLVRNVNHQKGKDIVVCKNLREVREAAKTKDFFVKWIPTQTEYRVWVFQNKALAIYEKVFKGEGEYEGFMRNHRFGFRFDTRDELLDNKKLTKPSIAAVKAIDLDFGAVDVLLGKDGKYYVLEVNSMGNIDSPKRTSGIRLAKEFSKWTETQ